MSLTRAPPPSPVMHLLLEPPQPRCHVPACPRSTRHKPQTLAHCSRPGMAAPSPFSSHVAAPSLSRSHVAAAPLAPHRIPGTPPTSVPLRVCAAVSRRATRCAALAGPGPGPGGAASPLPSPPAGFVLNEAGEVVLMAPESKRVLSLFDEAVGRTLECVVRRSFVSDSGLEFFLLYPLDVPVIVYRVGADGGLIEVDDAEVLDAFQAASYALARRNFHLVLSGYVLTVRGAVCFSQDDVTSINVQYGLGIGSDLSEGVEIAAFAHKGEAYLVYTPFDPLLFPAFRDPSSGRVLVAEDEELLDDPKVVEAIEEEQEYQRLVNEEEDMAEMLAEKEKALQEISIKASKRK